ncbi:type II toxin-antitoxin system VapC family toxin [Cuniculiplasma divulgatum]|uniref:VapC toxin n=1 Tax=Cuniculiplasma divulgatum TaxID=1673428 RepID=A0A1N5WHS3_9ARCH|nr:PIN domain-containing protein [Cuniculiplasma divulgatum]SIM84225.1 VapC toxin [Cuniculiplasma divulgatum]
MPYADTDFFIAISNSNDGLNNWAIKALENYKGTIFTSMLTLVELALVSVRKGVPTEGMIASVLSIAELKGASKQNALAAAHLIDHEGVGVFDAFHASLCEGEIISSDHIYEKLGVKRAGSDYL